MDQKSKASEHHFSVDVLEFFHVNDALEVTWAHAVNSRSKLQEALAGKVINKLFYLCCNFSISFLHFNFSFYLPQTCIFTACFT